MSDGLDIEIGDIDVNLATGEVTIQKGGGTIILNGAEQVENLGVALAAIHEVLMKRAAYDAVVLGTVPS